MSLSKHFDVLPDPAKDMALLIFRCQRSLLFPDPVKVRRSRSQARVNSGIQRTAPASSPPDGKGVLGKSHYRGGHFAAGFLQWVREKEQEDSVFWFKPERNLQKLSAFLENKHDPVTNLPYRPLLLDPQWWRVRFGRTAAKFVPNPRFVVAAIVGMGDGSVEIDIPVMQELIYQSNPSLDPVAKWPYAPSMRFLPRPSPPTHDYVGRGTRYKGYIDQERSMDGTSLPACVRDQTRIARWPESPRSDRLDCLHIFWQAEEAHSARRQAFALAGFAAVGGGPLTAR